MDPARLAEIELLFERASACPADAREALLRDACPDAELRAELERMIACQHDADAYFCGVATRMASVLGDALAAEPGAFTIGPYRTTGRLGHGGMGTVYAAERSDGQFEHRVAIKLVRADLDSDDAVARFRAERQILARLSHPGIARLLDGGITDDRRPYFVLELVDGEPIDRHCELHRLGIVERVMLIERVGEAVAYAHRNLVVHRDLKPSNILVTASGQPKLLDFGIAKPLDASTGATRTGARAMTPDYAAPEQILGATITTATDVHGLGLVLYELLTGRRPYAGNHGSASAVEQAILHGSPPAPSTVDRRLRGDLDNIVLMALRTEPERRYASVEQLCADLRCWRERLPVRARADTLGYRAGKFVRRHALAVAATLVVLAMATGFAISLAQQLARTEQERDKARLIAELLIELVVEADPSERHGRDVTAREVLDRGAARIEGLRGQPETQATLLDVMGRAYRNLGLYERAEPLLDRALQLRRDTLAADDPQIADSLRSLAELARLQGDHARAQGMIDEALAIHRAALGERDAAVAEDLTVAARVWLAMGQHARAEAALREALDIDRGLHGDERPSVAAELNDLGALLMREGRLEESATAYREALALRRRLHGDEHPAVAATLANLGSTLAAAGDHPGAEAAYREALEIYRSIHGETHPVIATTLSNLGAVRAGTGDAAGAEALYRHALAMRRELLGPSHPDIAQTASNLGLLLQQEGRLDDADPLMREALTMRRALLGDVHPLVGQSLNNLGLLLQARGQLDEAERSLRDALEILDAALGPSHPLVATNLSNIGAVQLDRGDLEGARGSFEQALALRRELLPAEHPHLAHTLLGLGRTLCAQGERSAGRALLEDAQRIRAAVLPATHRELLEVRESLASCR